MDGELSRRNAAGNLRNFAVKEAVFNIATSLIRRSLEESYDKLDSNSIWEDVFRIGTSLPFWKLGLRTLKPDAGEHIGKRSVFARRGFRPPLFTDSVHKAK
jgi:hypothetical protein